VVGSILRRATNKKYAREITENLQTLLSCPMLVTLLGTTITKAHTSTETYVDGECTALGITLADEERTKLLNYYRMFTDVAARMEAKRKAKAPVAPVPIETMVFEDV
jgi:hypothetical protein